MQKPAQEITIKIKAKKPLLIRLINNSLLCIFHPLCECKQPNLAVICWQMSGDRCKNCLQMNKRSNQRTQQKFIFCLEQFVASPQHPKMHLQRKRCFVHLITCIWTRQLKKSNFDHSSLRGAKMVFWVCYRVSKVERNDYFCVNLCTAGSKNSHVSCLKGKQICC